MGVFGVNKHPMCEAHTIYGLKPFSPRTIELQKNSVSGTGFPETCVR